MRPWAGEGKGRLTIGQRKRDVPRSSDIKSGEDLVVRSVLDSSEMTYSRESGNRFFVCFLVQFRFGSISLQELPRE